MTACRACGHEGPTRGIDDGTFLLSVCEACGFGMGLKPSAVDESGSVLSKVNMPSGPHTTAYQLSPTGPQEVVENPLPNQHKEADESIAPIVSPTRGGSVLVYTTREALQNALISWSADNEHYQIQRVDSGKEMVGQVIERIKDGTETDLYLLDNENADFPSVELGFAIRAIEAAFDVPRTKLTILGGSEESFEDACRRLGDAEALNLSDEVGENLPESLVTSLRALHA